MELDATHLTEGSAALAKTPAEHLKYQRQGRCWGCGKIGHIKSRCPINPSKPLSLVASSEALFVESGEFSARD
ncbi:hypothetical protein KC19_VG207700 [Ceratodon purpureus]|uniref:CCHC-type domain-containing protein n=1 Tax=Ceratodon purpureus TaxID=3225 RepID=A0A8T0HTA8_CERPU|nr:hypothetical protein KC19_VG207700 [Ceratodon purpureus]